METPCFRRSCVTLIIGLLLAVCRIGAANTSSMGASQPFHILGKWLDQSDDSNLKGAGAGKIERAFKVVASSQQALKTMDGAAHGLYAYSKARPKVKEWSRLDYSRATKAEKEDRLKAFRKAKLLEEAVYSAEMAELTAEGVTQNDCLSYVAELQSNHELLLEDFSTIQGGRFRFVLLLDHDSERVTLSVGDAMDWGEKLDMLREAPVAVPLRSRGLLQRSMNVPPRLWAAATAIVDKVRPQLARVLKEKHPEYGLHVVGFSLGAGVAAMVGGILDGAIHVRLQRVPATEVGGGTTATSIAGHVGEEARINATNVLSSPRLLQSAVGMAHDNVTTFVFAPPPCISKGVRGLHRFITSFVLGDDMIPRASSASLGRLEKRLVDYVPADDGGAIGGIYFDYARSWMKGVVGATLQQVVTHQVSKKDEEEEEGLMTLPGRVYYIKPRKLHGGATIKEVLRGNLREDILWQINDIFVSKSMLKHHSLDKYVTVLARIPL